MPSIRHYADINILLSMSLPAATKMKFIISDMGNYCNLWVSANNLSRSHLWAIKENGRHFNKIYSFNLCVENVFDVFVEPMMQWSEYNSVIRTFHVDTIHSSI